MANERCGSISEAFGKGPFHVEIRTNAHAEILDKDGREVACCSWSLESGNRARVLCAILNSAMEHENG